MIRKIYLLLLVAAAFTVAATAQAVSCNSGSNTAREGQTIICTSSAPVNVQLYGVGTLGGTTNNTTSWTYTAPASLDPVQNSAQGCMFEPNDSVFNTPIDNLPVHANNAAWHTGLNHAVLTMNPGWGFSVADNATPTISLKAKYNQYNPISNFVWPTFAASEAGTFKSGVLEGWNSDHHQITIRHTDCTMYETENRLINNSPNLLTCADGTTPDCNVAQWAEYPWSNYGFLYASTDATGSFPLTALTLRADEVRTGINHALRFSFNDYIISFTTVLWPAGSIDYNGCASASCVPYGARLRLRICNGTTITTNCVSNPSQYNQYQQNIINALATYGMFLADGTGGYIMDVSVTDDYTEDPAVKAAIDSVLNPWLTADDFDIVDEDALAFWGGSHQICPWSYTTCGINGNQTNNLEHPSNEALLMVTPTAGGSASPVPISLQPVLVGVPNATVSVGTGTTFTPSCWITGIAAQSVPCNSSNVTWTLQSGLGSVANNQ